MRRIRVGVLLSVLLVLGLAPIARASWSDDYRAAKACLAEPTRYGYSDTNGCIPLISKVIGGGSGGYSHDGEDPDDPDDPDLPIDVIANAEVSGPYTGTHSFTFDACEVAHEVFELTYQDTGTLVLDGCVADAEPLIGELEAFGYTYAGTFLLTTPDGDTLSGPFDGELTTTEILSTMSLVLDPDEVEGTISAEGTFDFDEEDGGLAAGVLVGNLE